MRHKNTVIGYFRSGLSGTLTLTCLVLTAATATAAGPLPSSRTTHPAPPGPAHRALAARIYHGDGFDTCQAPDLSTMDAWLAHSSYRAIGVYFGGRARACSSQTNLTADWVRRTSASGWSLLPIFVGSQSPCVSGANKNPYRIDTKHPDAQGAAEGADAIAAARAIGLDPGSALYLDMETYDIRDTACTTATLKFIQGWDRQVAAGGYLSGFYSSADSGAQHMENARLAGAADLPDALWYARWGVAADLTTEPSLAPGAWTPDARIHQYVGSATETHGGKRLNIDRDAIDAPVAVVG
ncbi:DUF1906 domain-containing protein [Streptomyces sp. NBC_01190]|uniref:DUF1906 domain-containing protein n=1 Tax=Streptomyces sp. NBC_01190 TaxID=2903767 RepID=UPI0038681D16|nr:DUF1906 domain-containing protein [Streptomyces sp. NBC_01190]